MDHYVFRPVAKGYKAVTPKPVRTCVSNMMDNLTEPRNAVNNVLQGKGNSAFVSFMRFIVNSTFGVFGCFDVASMGDLTPHSEDFGQTLGTWVSGTVRTSCCRSSVLPLSAIRWGSAGTM